jgi:hypothetical protein
MHGMTRTVMEPCRIDGPVGSSSCWKADTYRRRVGAAVAPPCVRWPGSITGGGHSRDAGVPRRRLPGAAFTCRRLPQGVDCRPTPGNQGVDGGVLHGIPGLRAVRRDIDEIQAAIRERPGRLAALRPARAQRRDGRLIGLGDLSRRFFVLVPAEGEPTASSTASSRRRGSSGPGSVGCTSAGRSWKPHCGDAGGVGTVAMEFSPGAAVPAIDLVPGASSNWSARRASRRFLGRPRHALLLLLDAGSGQVAPDGVGPARAGGGRRRSSGSPAPCDGRASTK